MNSCMIDYITFRTIGQHVENIIRTNLNTIIKSGVMLSGGGSKWTSKVSPVGYGQLLACSSITEEGSPNLLKPELYG